MDKKNISVKVVTIGIGAILMFVLMWFVDIPSGVRNTNLNLGIAILALFAAIFGPVAGFLVGFIGHFLNDMTVVLTDPAKDVIWWSWIISSALFGCGVGFFWKFYRIEEGAFGIKQAVIFNAVQILTSLMVWVGVAPTLDVLIYQEPADKVYLQGLVAGSLNSVVVLVLGTLLAFSYTKTRIISSSLKAD